MRAGGRRGEEAVVLRRHRLVVVATAGAVVFIMLTALVATGHADGVDGAVRRWMLEHRSPWLRSVAQGTTDVLSPPVEAAVLAVVAVLCARAQRSLAPAVVAIAVVAVTTGVVLGMKHGVGRPAPFLPLSSTGGSSFPSGHTAATLVFLGSAVLLAAGPGVRRRRLLAGVASLTVLCAAGVVYADYHWLTDTLASAALGTAVLSTVVATGPLWVSRCTAPPSPPASRTRSPRS
jgi:membrane-associated phospholipid phosphatase